MHSSKSMRKLYGISYSKKKKSARFLKLRGFLMDFVELKGVEPLSSCVINYAFYMLIFHLVLEMRPAGNRP